MKTYNQYGFRWQVGLAVTALIILPFIIAATIVYKVSK